MEKNNKDQIIKKIHISINDIKNLLYKYICRYNDKCFDETCSLKHNIKPDFTKNYRNLISDIIKYVPKI